MYCIFWTIILSLVAAKFQISNAQKETLNLCLRNYSFSLYPHHHASLHSYTNALTPSTLLHTFPPPPTILLPIALLRRRARGRPNHASPKTIRRRARTRKRRTCLRLIGARRNCI